MHHARKRFGQNFLKDDGAIHAIIKIINPSADAHLIEIGPGLGALTLPLLNYVDHIDLLEIDRDLVAYWRAKNLPGVQVIEGDALHFDFVRWAKNSINKSIETGTEKNLDLGRRLIVGNVPYNISSPLLFQLLSVAPLINEQVFMLQAEVVARLVAPAGSADFSRLSVMLQARYEMEQVLEVPPTAFEPQPKVNSAVVRMIPRTLFSLNKHEWRALEKIVAAAFSQRRKMLRTNLKSYLERLAISDTELKLRAQDIPVSRYIEWASSLAKTS